VVSSIYLESLKTYEAFAASEQLFQQAVERFQLRDGRGSLQSLHNSVLKVRVLPGTRLLEIRCTLPDPQKAHALAVYLADETIKLSRGVSQQSDDETIARAEKQFELAKARLDQVYGAQRGAAGVSETERSSAREGFEEAERRLADARAAAGYRTERLAIVDPGVAPERPSSPRMLVNLIAALWIAAVASILFLTLQFSYSRRPTAQFTRARRGNYD
jgi:capsular polysaccharide biosynthesis protein